MGSTYLSQLKKMTQELKSLSDWMRRTRFRLIAEQAYRQTQKNNQPIPAGLQERINQIATKS